MEVIVFDTIKEASQKALDIFQTALNNGAQTFGLATGSTPEVLYALMVDSSIDFTNATSINLDEYYGLDAEHPQSYRYFMNEKLFHHKPFKEIFLPDGTNTDAAAETERYNQIIAEHPIDLQLLGLGTNGHIGFNEPGTDFQGKTQLVELSESTIESNKRYFASAAEVPTQAYSMGIASIMESDHILLLAFGEAKAKAVQQMIEGPVSNEIPASVLQQHSNVTVLLDKEAASLLSK